MEISVRLQDLHGQTGPIRYIRGDWHTDPKPQRHFPDNTARWLFPPRAARDKIVQPERKPLYVLQWNV